jgi:hypothetical protein
MIKKLFVCAVFVFLGFFTLSLPDPYLSDVEGLATEQAYDRLPDADLRTIAEQEWEAGRKETAISILDYIIEGNMGDAAGARVLKEQYVNRIQADESVTGRFQAAAYGFATGNVEDMPSLVGSSVADFLIYGDIRDLVREFVFEDDTDEIVVALSAAGILTTIYPPAEGAVTATKALKKASVFSEPMTALLKRRLKGFKDLSTPGKISRVKDNFQPFLDLARQSKSWGGFTTMVRHCQNLDQVKLLAKLASLAPENGKRVGQILAVAGSKGIKGTKQFMGKQVISIFKAMGNQGMKTIEQTMVYLQKFGQKGMDQLYAALRKGPAGLRFVAAHPTLTARTLKNVKKATPLALGALYDRWNQFMVKHRAMAIMVKYGMAALFFMIAGIQLVFLFRFNGSKRKSGGFSWKAAIWVIVMSSVLVFSVLIYNQYSGAMPKTSETFQGVQTGGGSVEFSEYNRGIVLLLIGVFLFNGVVYSIIYRVTNGKLKDIHQSPISAQEKLSFVENIEIYFDLPMYIGLFLTILSFLLITVLNAESARLLAYISTLCGIGVSAYMRVTILQRNKEKLLHAARDEAAGKESL